MKTLSVIHIEKCGGTSLRNALKLQVGDSHFRQCYDTSGITSVAKEIEQGKEIQAIYGHFSFGVHKALGIEPNYATQVREPIARYVSHFTHWRNRLKFNHNRQYILHACPTIEKFVDDPVSNTITNFMVRRIANVHPSEHVTGWHLEEAIENLRDYFRVVTFIEEPYACNDKWNEYLQCDDFRIGHLNRGNSEENFPSDEYIEKVKKANNLDMLLYAECLKLFK